MRLTKRLQCCALAQTMLTLTVSVPLAAAEFNLESATIEDINRAFDAGALNSEKLVQLYLDRISAYPGD